MSEIKTIGILAYGSLIDDPGDEIAKFIKGTIDCITPFHIEFARSSKSRGGAPTLIPVETGGSVVSAKILVLEKVSIVEAADMLWRRETREKDANRHYPNKKEPSVNDVVVKELDNFEGIEKVLYTSIGQNIEKPNAAVLAKLAIESFMMEKGDRKRDGLHYLLNAKNNGIQTPLSSDYESEILKITKTINLTDALTLLTKQRFEYEEIKQEQDDFEKQYRDIGHLIHTNGIKHVPDKENVEDLKTYLEEHSKEFVKNVHSGFKEGQKRILDLLLDLEKQKSDLQLVLRSTAGAGARDAKRAINEKIKRIENRENLLRHLFDSIVWQLINGQLYIARKLYQGVKGHSKLSNTNIQSVIAAVNEINKDPDKFALITDLSHYVQLGDVMEISAKGLQFYEVKEGKKNHQVLTLIKSILKQESTINEAVKEPYFNKDFGGQLKRTVNQLHNANRIIDIINTDEGFDKDGNEVKIITPNEDTARFDEELVKLEEQLKTRGFWAYGVVDNCLHIALYKGPLQFGGPKILEGMAVQKGYKYMIADYYGVISSLNRPIFTLPFSEEMIYDILFRRVILFFMIDLDTYISYFHELGLTARWMTRKETAMLRDQYKDLSIYTQDNQGIVINEGDKRRTMYLSIGMLQKMFFELITPTYTVYSTTYYLAERMKRMGGKIETAVDEAKKDG